MAHVQEAIRKIEPIDSVERYTGLGVDVFLGEARIVSPFEVCVAGRTLTTRSIVVATGASPLVPRFPGLESVPHYHSDSLWALETLPERLLVLGGGPIGCELAQAFARLGSKVTLVERSERLLSKEDDDVGAFVEALFAREGLTLLMGHTVEGFAKGHGVSEGASLAKVKTPQGTTVDVPFDAVLVALGRKANTKGFGLEDIGVTLRDDGTIAADERMRTNLPGIYACGDVTGPFQFTHAASHQAWYAGVNALFSPFWSFKAEYRFLPWTTFLDPEIARVGLNEAQAKEQKVEHEVTTYHIAELDRAIAEKEDHGFVKVITAKGTARILGVTIVGAHAGELLTEFVAAMRAGKDLNFILGTVHAYPTFAESNKAAAGKWKKAHAPAWILARAKSFFAWRRG